MSEEKITEPLYYNGYISLDERAEIREYIKELNNKVELQANALKEKDEMLNNRNGVIEHLNLRINRAIEYLKETTCDFGNDEMIFDKCDAYKLLSILKGKDVK